MADEGVFQPYLATATVTLGRLGGHWSLQSSTPGVLVEAGTKVLWDGATVKIPSTSDAFKSTTFSQAIAEGVFIALATSVIEIATLADFPTPVDGVIQLLPSSIYLVRGEVNLGANVINGSPDAIILGNSAAHDGLITSSASPLLTVNDGGAYGARNIVLYNTIGPALYYNGNSTGSPLFSRVVLLGGEPSTFIDCVQVQLTGIYIEGPSQGIQFEGLIEHLTMTSCVFKASLDPNFIGLHFLPGSTLRGLSLLQTHIEVTGSQIAIKQDATASVSQARVSLCDFSGGGTVLDGFTKASLGWSFQQNLGVVDSAISLGAGWASETAVVWSSPGQNTWQIVPGTMVIGASERIAETASGSNIFEYLGHETGTIAISGSVGLAAKTLPAVLSAGIAHNGTVVDVTEVSVNVDAGGKAGVVLPVSFSMPVEPGDVGSIHLRNLDDGNDIEVYSVHLSVIGR